MASNVNHNFGETALRLLYNLNMGSVKIEKVTLDENITSDDFKLPDDYQMKYLGPIKHVEYLAIANRNEVTRNETKRYKKFKPTFIKAMITKDTTDTGEVIETRKVLADVIRARGPRGHNFHCSHVIPRLWGGKMIDLNLVPLPESVNKFTAGTYCRWRLLENAVAIFVDHLVAKVNPSVFVESSIVYDDEKRFPPDCPTSITTDVMFSFHTMSPEMNDRCEAFRQEFINLVHEMANCKNQKEKDSIKEKIRTMMWSLNQDMEKFGGGVLVQPGDVIGEASSRHIVAEMEQLIAACNSCWTQLLDVENVCED